MADLIESAPLAGLDVTHGAARLTASDPGRLTWLAPFPGAEAALSDALHAAHGLRFPEPGHTTTADGQTLPCARCLWSGRAQALLIGPAPDPALAPHGAALDVTEAWAALTLTGPATAAVLARLTPLDLSATAFAPGHTTRSLLGHIHAQFTARPDGIDLLVPRSMARTAAHEIEAAMRRLAARAHC